MSNAVRQLRLVTEPAPVHGTTTDPVRAAFERWVFMFGKNPKLCKMDAGRSAAIRQAIEMYGAEMIEVAIDGMSSRPLKHVHRDVATAMREPEWFLSSAKRIEQAIEYGLELRAEESAKSSPAVDVPEPTPEEREAQAQAKRAAMETLRARSAALRAAHG